MAGGVFRRPWRPVVRRVLPSAVVSTDVSTPFGPGLRPVPWWILRQPERRPQPRRVHPPQLAGAAPTGNAAVLPKPKTPPHSVFEVRYRPPPRSARVFPTVPPVVLLPTSTLKRPQPPIWLFRTKPFRPAAKRSVVRVIVTGAIVCTEKKWLVDLNLIGNELLDAGAVYLGDKDTDGTWRFTPSGTGLVVARRESGVYVTKRIVFANPKGVTITDDATLDNENHVVICDTSNGPFALTLPPSASTEVFDYEIKNVGPHPVTVLPDGDDQVEMGSSIEFDSPLARTLHLLGTNWHIL